MMQFRISRSILLVSCFIFMSASAAINSPAGKPSPAGTYPRKSQVSGIAGKMLSFHNAIRSEMNLPPFQWSGELASFSQKWADTLIARNRSAHNPNSPYGENIFISGPGCDPARVVREWASESQLYSYSTNACAGDCGHYTQIIWRSSRRLGCGVARNKQREVWVCSYDPPGNYRGERPY